MDKDTPILQGYKKIELTYCRNCCSYLYKGKYYRIKEFNKNFNQFIKKHFSFNVEPIEFQADNSILINPTKNMTLKVLVAAQIDGKIIEEEVSVPVKLLAIECQNCSRLKGGYFEGIFQLRNKENDQYQEVLERIKKEFYERKDVDITNEMIVNGGTDFYVTNNKFLQSLVSKLHKEYGGESIISCKLHGINKVNSKQVYRINALLRLPNIVKGDIIKHNEKLYKVCSFSGDKFMAESLMDFKHKPLKLSDDYELKVKKKDYVTAIITKFKPRLEVLHPVTYESVEVVNVSGSDKCTNIVIVDEQAYCVDEQ